MATTSMCLPLWNSVVPNIPIDLPSYDSPNDAGFGNNGFNGAEDLGDGQPGGDDKCFGCGEIG